MELITNKVENEILTIFLKGRVDSSNAAKLGEEIEGSRQANPHKTVVLDADKLEYMSSAGLRVVLRLLKEEPSLKIVNASSEVYEVFEMTGFTEMMSIEKGYRHISVEGCEVIGQGANGKVYRTDPDTIVKVYKNPDSLPDIKRERELARRAFVLGIPTAIPFDVVRVGDGYGSVFELLNATSFAKLAKREPENIDHYIQLSVDLLKKIHNAEVAPDEMPDEKKVVVNWCEFMKNYLPAEKQEKLMKMVNAVPESNHMLHGDCHFKNVMLQNGEVLLIDMDTLCHGDPVFEFASMYNAYLGFGDFDHSNIENFLGLSYETGRHIWEKSVEDYFGTSDKAKIESVTKKSKLLGYIRIYRRALRRHLEADAEEQKRLNLYFEEISKLIDEIDDLIL